MFFKLDSQSALAVFEQIAWTIKTRIAKGDLKKDDRLPSVRELALQLSVNPNTVHKAYAQLVDEGHIYAQAGKGLFVSTPPVHTKQWPAPLPELAKELLLEAKLKAYSPDDIKTLIEQLSN